MKASELNAGPAPHQPFGTYHLADGRYAFRIWAPDAQEALLELGGEKLAMQAHEDGVFGIELDTQPHTPYRYVIDGAAVPDPAARVQRAEWSVVEDPDAYIWRHEEWRGRPWRETVMYELHVGAMGGFDGLRQALPAIADLGVTAIELMPIATFPGQRNWGYDGALPYAPQDAYGSPSALKEMIDTAHGLGLQVFLDVVYNHFGPVGNWLPHYASEFFTRDSHTPWGAAINFENHKVSEYFIQNALYWLHEFRFDGLRLDAVHTIGNLRWLHELAARVRASVAPGRHVHLVLENERNESTLLDLCYEAQWNDDFHHCLHVMLTDEHGGFFVSYSDDPASHLARVLKEGFAYQGEASPLHKDEPRGEPSHHLSPIHFVSFLQNHDQIGNRPFGDRLTTLTTPAKLKAAVALQLLCPQIPLLFMGEEWGSKQPFLFFTDHDEDLARIVRKGRKREFGLFTEHADPARAAHLPDPNAEKTFLDSRPGTPNIAREEDRDWLDHYRTLLALRARDIAPFLDEAKAVDSCVLGPKAVAAQWRLDNGALLTIAINLGDAVSRDSATLPGWLRGGSAAPAHFAVPMAAAGAPTGGTLPADCCVAWLIAGN